MQRDRERRRHKTSRKRKAGAFEVAAIGLVAVACTPGRRGGDLAR
jgi:hypothetical protein